MAPAAGEAFPFPDNLLEDILIRLPTLEDFGRACASCPPSAASSPATPSSAACTGSIRGRSSASTPSPRCSTPWSRHTPPPAPPAESADFEFSFLPGPGFWMVRDACGGRFVLDRDEGTDDTFTTIAVSDPLFRRYVLLPPIPEDLAAAVERPLPVNGERRCDVFFAPCGEGEESAAVAGAPDVSFKVIWMAQCPTKLVAFVFSSASRQWQAIASTSWHHLNPAMSPVTDRSVLLFRSYAYGCFYWFLSGFPFGSSKLIVLDIDKMEFYPVNHPSGHRLEEFAIVELGENRLGMFMFPSNYIQVSALQLFSANRPNNHGVDAIQWVQENIVLPPTNRFNMLGVADGKLLLYSSAPELGCISLDFKTTQLQKVRGMIHNVHLPMLALYTGYPLPLSLPTI